MFVPGHILSLIQFLSLDEPFKEEVHGLRCNSGDDTTAQASHLSDLPRLFRVSSTKTRIRLAGEGTDATL